MDEPRYRFLILALTPQPHQVPLPPFDRDALHETYRDVTKIYSYQSFEFVFEGRGALFHNGEQDLVELRPALLRIQAQMDGPDVLTGSMAVEKTARILEIAGEKLGPEIFTSFVLQIVGAVDAPGGDALKFVGENLLRDPNQAATLGDGFFGGGVRYRALRTDEGGEDSLSVEPFVHDNSLVHLDYQMNRATVGAPITLEQVTEWTQGAFDFLGGPTVELLSS